MKRDLEALASQEFDLIVVGGGIAGISVARDAALRGLSVALVEQYDFASGSTGRTLGMIHGGIRCLQRLDLGRLRALSVERNTPSKVPAKISPLPLIAREFTVPPKGPLVCCQKSVCAYAKLAISKTGTKKN